MNKLNVNGTTAGRCPKVSLYSLDVGLNLILEEREFSLKQSRLTLLSVTIIIIECVSAIGCSSAHSHAQVHPPQPTSQENLSTITAPTNWRKVDSGPFSILAPPGWEFHQLEGVDSYVGEFVGDSIVLTFDFGGYSNSLKEEKKPAYVVIHESIGGRRAKIVSPRTPGHGITGVYFRNVGYSNSALTLFGHDLTSTQQQLVLKIFETLRFGGPPPRYVLPPPPTKNVE